LAAGVARWLATVLADHAVLRHLRKASLLRGQRNFGKICKEAKFELPQTEQSHNSENIVD
jgi:hypothetical protein